MFFLATFVIAEGSQKEFFDFEIKGTSILNTIYSGGLLRQKDPVNSMDILQPGPQLSFEFSNKTIFIKSPVVVTISSESPFISNEVTK